jgi:hypothetical protein
MTMLERQQPRKKFGRQSGCTLRPPSREDTRMPKVKNENVAGRSVHVLDAMVQFDGEGIATVTDAQAEVLSQVPFYEILDEKPVAKESDEKPAPKKASKKSDAASTEKE